MFFNRTPHPYEYDYDYNEISDNTINMQSLLCLFMKNFIPNYIFPREVQCLPMKYLKIFQEFVIVHKIDNYYIKFKEQSSVNTITSMSILSPYSVVRKVSSTTILSPKCDTVEATPINKDTKGSVYNGSMSLNQNHQCSILRKPSYANKMKRRSEVIPNNNPSNNNNNNNISVTESTNINSTSNVNNNNIKPTIDTTTNSTTNQSLNDNNIMKSNSADSNSPFILNVESRDDSPIYRLTPPNLPPCYSSSSTGTNNNNNKYNNMMKPNLRPTSTSLNTIQISHSNSNGTLPPTYPLRPLASSCDENRFSSNYNKKIKNNNNILERSSSSGSVTIPGFIYPSSNEDNYGDDNCMDMQV